MQQSITRSDHANTEAPIKMNYSINSPRLEVKVILVWEPNSKLDTSKLKLSFTPNSKLLSEQFH